MNNLIIKHEKLSERCEICHQADFYDAVNNHCARCANVPDLLLKNRLVLAQYYAYLNFKQLAGAVIFGGISGFTLSTLFSVMDGLLVGAIDFNEDMMASAMVMTFFGMILGVPVKDIIENVKLIRKAVERGQYKAKRFPLTYRVFYHLHNFVNTRLLWGEPSTAIKKRDL